MQFVLLLALLMAPNLALAGHNSLAQLMEASDEECRQELAQITPEQEQQIESELIEEVKHTVGPLHVGAGELEKPRGVARLCEQLPLRIDCAKAKRSKEACAQGRALLETMARELNTATPAEMDQKANAYNAEIGKIVQKIGEKKTRRERRGFRGNCKLYGRVLWGSLKEMWGEWWLKTELKREIEATADNKEDLWKRGTRAKFVLKLLGSVLNLGSMALLEVPLKVLLTIGYVLIAIWYTLFK